jgi:hypothetical protein
MEGPQPGSWMDLLRTFGGAIFQSESFQANFWASAFGALVGAGAAFILERTHAAHAERRRRVTLGNQAIHKLGLMYSSLASLEKSLFGEHRRYRTKHCGRDFSPRHY